MDRAIHRDARARMARRLSAPRRGGAEGDGTHQTRRGARGFRKVEAVARLRRASPLEKPGDTCHDRNTPASPTARRARSFATARRTALGSPEPILRGPEVLSANAMPEWHEDREAPRRSPQCAQPGGRIFRAARRTTFDLPPGPRRQRLPAAVCGGRPTAIPLRRDRITCVELAARAGAPGSARAAGAATGRNPISIIVPCHRGLANRRQPHGLCGRPLRARRGSMEIEGALLGREILSPSNGDPGI